jgi:hypothetical protein
MGRLLIFVVLAALISPFAVSATASPLEFKTNTSEVHVQFAHGEVVLDKFTKGTQFFANQQSPLVDYPSEMEGMEFTRHNVNDAADVTLDVPAGTTLYAIFGSGGPARRAREYAETSGWTRFGEAQTDDFGQRGTLIIYKKHFDQAKIFTMAGSGGAGDTIVGPNLVLVEASNDKPQNSPSTPPPTNNNDSNQPLSLVRTQLDNSGDSPITPVSKLQVSTEGLAISELESGEMLGQAMRIILTATSGEPKEKDSIPVTFTVPVGHDMQLVLDDVARAINVHYRLGGVKKLELSFEDKYTIKDGGSVGAAIGTLMLSMIRGLDIDPKIAITGDVTADGQIGKVGGIAAKLRCAAKSDCTLVALPADNFQQVQDAIVYDGPTDISSVQIIGVATLDEAADVARADRDSKLAQAIDLFSQIQASMKQSSKYIFHADAQDKLKEILELAPNHDSAKLLLSYSRHELPRLSAGATEYYISVAVKEYWDTPATSAHVADYSAEDALKKLNKLRPIGDLTVRPYLDAWVRLIELYSRSRAGGSVSTEELTAQYQVMLNAASKLNTNRDLSEKLLHEGI